MQSLSRSTVRILGLVAALLTILSARPAFAQSTLRVGDTLDLRLAGVPAEEVTQFTALYTIDEGGTLNLPYIGAVKIAGLPANEAQTLIEEKLKSEKIYTHPTVLLIPQQNSRFVNIGGQVRSPGRIIYTADLTLMSAINAAGGFNDYADQKRVQFVRNGKKEIIDARKLIKDPSKDQKVQPGDQITVPQSLW